MSPYFQINIKEATKPTTSDSQPIHHSPTPPRIFIMGQDSEIIARPIRNRLQCCLAIVFRAGVIHHYDLPRQLRLTKAFHDRSHIFSKMTGISVTWDDKAEVDF